jgi:hypothetical protein
MANRREEERERLRQVREERESQRSKANRKRLVGGYVAAGVIGLVVVVGVIAVIASSSGGEEGGAAAHIDLESGSSNAVAPDDRSGPTPPPVKVSNLKQAARQAGCVLRLRLRDEGHNHLPPDAETPKYETNPPTSGAHVEPPYQQADGAYSETPSEIDMVHSLEHGRMEIQYSPDLPEADQLALKGLYETLYGGTLLFPNSRMPYEVAATTWTNLLGCKEYRGAITMDAIRAFGKSTWGRYGGEPVNGFGLKGPTPLEPAS